MADSSWQDDVLRGSVFDRLIQGETKRGSGVGVDYIGVRELRASVARHLEWLLNSRAWVPWDMSNFSEARDSNLTYGLPDLSNYSWRSSRDASSVATCIRDTIKRFEPRLLARSVKVEAIRSEGVDDFTLHFRIDAILSAEPIHEPVSFDTNMELGTGAISVAGGG